MLAPVPVYVVYAPEDDGAFLALNRHLTAPSQSGLVEVSGRRTLLAGAHTDAECDAKLEQAALILVLASVDLVASARCQKEAARAHKRARAGATLAAVLHVRPCEVRGTSMARLPALLARSQPVCLWDDQDQAWTAAAREVCDLASQIQQGRRPRLRMRRTALAVLCGCTILGAAVRLLLWPHAPPPAGAVAVTVSAMDYPLVGGTYKRLCAALRTADPAHTACAVGLPKSKAAYTDSSGLLVVVYRDYLSVTARTGLSDLLSGLPEVRLPFEADAQDLATTYTVRTLHALARIDADRPPSMELPGEPPIGTAPVWMVLGAFVRVYQVGAAPQEDALQDRERQRLGLVAADCKANEDWSCARARYLYAALCPACEDSARILGDLQQAGPQPVARLAASQLAQHLCASDPLQATTYLERLARGADLCEAARWLGTAACIIEHTPAPVADWLRALAETPSVALTRCDRVVSSRALAARAYHRAIAGRWGEVIDDLAAARAAQPLPVYLLNQTEAFLHLGRFSEVLALVTWEVVQELSGSTDQGRALWFRWLATGGLIKGRGAPKEAAALRALYEALKPGKAVLQLDLMQRQLVCSTPDATACRVFLLLSAPRVASGAEELAQLLPDLAPVALAGQIAQGGLFIRCWWCRDSKPLGQAALCPRGEHRRGMDEALVRPLRTE